MAELELEIGDVIKLNGVLLEITEIIPHQDIPGAVYYQFHNGFNERDIRLHPDSVYKKII